MWTLQPTLFDQLPGWAGDDHLAAMQAFARQDLKPADETYKQGQIGIPPESFSSLIKAAMGTAAQQSPRAFFEENFVPYRVEPQGSARGQVTGFYEPEVTARLERNTQFHLPIYARPTDLIALDDGNRPAELDSSYRFGRLLRNGTIGAYFNRRQINAGAIKDKALPLAFLEDPIESFFVHIQGAARLRLEDGSMMRVTFDGKNGHPFTPIGKLLVQRGEIDANDVSMQSIKKWLRSHPERAMQLMEENQSYIFFKQSKAIDVDLGPIAAAKVPLTAGRSLAVDKQIHTFGTPIFVSAREVNNKAFSRLMIAQETGTAIVGPARGDIFFGSGDQAGEMAGAVNSECSFTVLVPKTISIQNVGGRHR